MLLLPDVCARCGRPPGDGRPLCARCDASLPRLPARGCPLCQEPGAPDGAACAACRAEALPYDACLAAAPFAGEVAEWIRRFKYPGAGFAGLDPAAEAVAAWLAREAARRSLGPAPDRVVPVPLHRARLRARGFHPAAVLARAIARERGLRVDRGVLVRIRDTPSQTGLDRAARRRNVAGAFRAARPVPATLWLVDDVVTTGATLAAAARALRAAGAHRIVALCAARTPGGR
jgi:ComF family protein